MSFSYNNIHSVKLCAFTQCHSEGWGVGVRNWTHFTNKQLNVFVINGPLFQPLSMEHYMVILLHDLITYTQIK